MNRRTLSIALLAASLAATVSAQDHGPSGDESRLAAPVQSSLDPTLRVVASQTLQPDRAQDQRIRDDLDLKVTLLTLENGARELRTTLEIRPNVSEEVTIDPDAERGTYTVTITPVERETLVREGLVDPFDPPGPRIDDPKQKIFGGAFCRRVDLLSRDNTGPQGVIRAQTLTMLDWRWYSDSGFQCLEILDRAFGCLPAFGMTKAGCLQITHDDGTKNATQTTSGHYTGTPPGSIAIDVFNITRIRARTYVGTLEVTSLVLPIEEPSSNSFIVLDNLYNCTQPH